MGYILAWLIGIPIPIFLLVSLLRGCSLKVSAKGDPSGGIPHV